MIKKLYVLAASFLLTSSFAQTTCTGGFAGIFPCDKIDLMAHLSFLQMGGTLATEGNDCWGWTDPLTGKEYALMGCTSHTAFVDVSNPTAPVYLGKVNSRNNISSLWRDIKVYNDHAFIVSEATGHGMQVFDLKRLRNITTPQIFAPDALYSGFGNCHNIAINETTGYAYCIGSNTFSGGPHVVNIQNPTSPVFSFGYSDQAYTHDAQIVIYNGPDTQHVGKEIYFGANENKVVVLDVTNKNNPILLSTFFYPNISYTHQGWLTTNQKYWIVGDEIDELDFGFNTRSIVVDMTNLDSPVLKTEYVGMTPAIDHNGYTLNNEFYLANYRAGLRLMNTSDINNGNVNEIAYFDTYPENNNAEFNGAWSNYPYFASGNILVSDIDRGLFIVRKNAALGTVQHEINNTSLSPNPASFNVTLRSSEVITTIEVFDAVGKRVKSYRDIGANDYEFGVTDLQSGFYLVKINQSTTQKLMIR